MLWTFDEAAAAAKGEKRQTTDCEGISAVIHDSRDVPAGSLFIALKGPNHDAHKFVGEVLEKGAAAAMVSRVWWQEEGEKNFPAGNFIIVDDTLEGLVNLATAARARSRARVIGITGSVGKTSTKEFLATVLSGQGKCHANKKSFNNHWGVPLTLANLPKDADFAVIEMGINHTGEMGALARMVAPDIAIVTNIEPAHIGNFNAIEEIALAKSEIFSAMEDGVEKGGIAVLNADNPYTPILKKAAEDYGAGRILTCGETSGADARLRDCTLLSDGSRVSVKILGDKYKYHLPVPGKHFVLNSLSILLVAKLLGCDMDKAVKSLEHITPVEGRGNHISVYLEDSGTPVTVIDESYNASPVSMKAALRVLEMSEPATGGRRIAVLGDMLELGAEGARLHIDLANPVLKAKTDLLFACGPLMEALYNIIPPSWQGGWAADSKILAQMLTETVRPGDIVLVKGSLGSRMAYVVQALQDLHVPGRCGNENCGSESCETESGKAREHAV